MGECGLGDVPANRCIQECLRGDGTIAQKHFMEAGFECFSDNDGSECFIYKDGVPTRKHISALYRSTWGCE